MFDIWKYALTCIDPSCGRINMNNNPDFYYFYLLYLIQKHNSSLVPSSSSSLEEPVQFSIFKKSDKFLGNGIQGAAYDVTDNPDKAMKIIICRSISSYNSFKNESRFLTIASDNGFGPIVYEISADGIIVDIKNLPPFKENMEFRIVMDKIVKIETEHDLYSTGIVNTWKLMRKNNMLNVDGDFALLPDKTVVSIDFGSVEETNNDENFIDHLHDYDESSDYIYEPIMKKFVDEFPEDEFSINILKPVLSLNENSRELRKINLEKKRIEREKKIEAKKIANKEMIRRRREASSSYLQNKFRSEILRRKEDNSLIRSNRL